MRRRPPIGQRHVVREACFLHSQGSQSYDSLRTDVIIARTLEPAAGALPSKTVWFWFTPPHAAVPRRPGGAVPRPAPARLGDRSAASRHAKRRRLRDDVNPAPHTALHAGAAAGHLHCPLGCREVDDRPPQHLIPLLGGHPSQPVSRNLDHGQNQERQDSRDHKVFWWQAEQEPRQRHRHGNTHTHPVRATRARWHAIWILASLLTSASSKVRWLPCPGAPRSKRPMRELAAGPTSGRRREARRSRRPGRRVLRQKPLEVPGVSPSDLPETSAGGL